MAHADPTDPDTQTRQSPELAPPGEPAAGLSCFPEPKALSSRQQAILSYVEAFIRRHRGRSPTVREIRAATGISSTSIVTYHLAVLVRRGLLASHGDGAARELVLVGQRVVLPGEQVRVRVGGEVLVGELVS